MDKVSVEYATRKRLTREAALREAMDRHRHELMDSEERLVLEERIRRLKKSL